MSQTEVDRFLADLATDAELAREWKRLDADLDAAVRWLNARGYDFSRAEAEALDRELSDEELDSAAGGWTDPNPPPTGSS